MSNRSAAEISRSRSLVVRASEYAAADKSDPFAFNRAMTHLKNGIADCDATYSADQIQEIRHLPNGMSFSNGETTYHAVAHINRTRP